MNDRRSHARAWLAKAESDLTAARRLLEAEGPFDAVCFHAQQAAEKALKALLAFAQVEILRTHNLEDLQVKCADALAGQLPAELATLNLSELTPYAVEARYDAEFWPDHAAAASAAGTAGRVVDLVSAFLREAATEPDAG